MKVTDEALLRSGFTQPELQKIKVTLKNMEERLEAINDLAEAICYLGGSGGCVCLNPTATYRLQLT